MVEFKTVTKPSVPMPENNVDALYQSVMALKQLVEGMQLEQGEPGIQGDPGDPGPPGPPGPGALLATPLYFTFATYSVAGYHGVFNADDSVPQITGGDRVFQQAFTALNAAHRVRVKSSGPLYSTLAANFKVALFIDGAANAVFSRDITLPAGYMNSGRIEWEGVLPAGAHTYEIRVGSNVAGYYINGNSTNRIGGGTQAWTLQIEEVNAP